MLCSCWLVNLKATPPTGGGGKIPKPLLVKCPKPQNSACRTMLAAGGDFLARKETKLTKKTFD